MSMKTFEGFYRQYRPFADEATPQVRAALEGDREVPPQPSRIEAWVIYSLFSRDEELTLQMLMLVADSINKMVPTPDEISWALLNIRKRGWLTQHGDVFGLTIEARRAIEAIVGGGDRYDQMEQLEKWIVSHSPSGD